MLALIAYTIRVLVGEKIRDGCTGAKKMEPVFWPFSSDQTAGTIACKRNTEDEVTGLRAIPTDAPHPRMCRNLVR